MANVEKREVRGVLGEKLGMTQVFDENNRIVAVTVVKAGPCVVTQIRTEEKDGYSAVQLAYGQIDPRKVNKPKAGHFKAAGVTPRRHLIELRTDAIGEYEIGQELGADVFADGAAVDVSATTKGKGTAGVMKRHGFHGLGAGHGVQRKHRSPGIDRRLCHAGSRVQGHADGRSDGPRPADDAEPVGAEGRRRARPAAHQGRRPRPQGRHRPRP